MHARHSPRLEGHYKLVHSLAQAACASSLHNEFVRTVTKMRVVGLTGGIATGKSTVSALLETYQVPILDCDKIAKSVVQKVRRPRFQNWFCFYLRTLLLPCCLQKKYDKQTSYPAGQVGVPPRNAGIRHQHTAGRR